MKFLYLILLSFFLSSFSSNTEKSKEVIALLKNELEVLELKQRCEQTVGCELIYAMPKRIKRKYVKVKVGTKNEKGIVKYKLEYEVRLNTNSVRLLKKKKY